jgi:hypothetical protein
MRKSASDGQRRKRRNPNPRFQRNLLRRLERPAYRNGKIQKMCERAMSGLIEADTRQIACWVYCEIAHRGDRFQDHHYYAVRRAMRSMGYVPVGRGGGQGRAIVWRSGDQNR